MIFFSKTRSPTWVGAGKNNISESWTAGEVFLLAMTSIWYFASGLLGETCNEKWFHVPVSAKTQSPWSMWQSWTPELECGLFSPDHELFFWRPLIITPSDIPQLPSAASTLFPFLDTHVNHRHSSNENAHILFRAFHTGARRHGMGQTQCSLRVLSPTHNRS